eukprot:TRINITY_DN536_c0_g1_i1.p1 TRINITY_DN536_c0_g1~~TRINITY_DN536_c0_g1_i1.p1  ORF type:complete len:314 (+),score=37.55 TRINITY_DN536_c0_g1_i1:61-942(+)
MAGETAENLKRIVSDLKSNWYFRVWALIWVTCAIVAFVGLIVLGNDSRKAKQHKDLKIWMENATQIQYPRFHFRTEGDEIITYVNCTVDGQVIPIDDCQEWHGVEVDTLHCRAVRADQYSMVQNNWVPADMLGISCNVQTIGNNTQEGNLIAWEIEGKNMFVGGDPYETQWIAPTNGSWIQLIKGETETKDHGNITTWERNLIYHTNVHTKGYYHVRVVIESWLIRHFSFVVTYNGWQAVGGIGGIAFFLVLIHTAFMAVIGFCFGNDSSFLNKSSTHTSGTGRSDYASVADN